MHELSYNMVDVQLKKLKLKKKELKLMKKALNVQQNVLTELKEIKMSLQTWTTDEQLT